MRLVEVELIRFKRHEHLLVSLIPGMNVVRGDSEAGKSSVLMGIGYCFFGAAALDETLDKVIHWDHASGMMTRAKFVLGDVEYECRRGTSGAELAIAGEVKVTGQREVTTRMLELLGMQNVATALNTVIGGQDAIRGVLSLGPTAAINFIESLVDFSEVDALIKDIQAKHPCGPTKQMEEDLATLRTQVAEHVVVADPQPLLDRKVECERQLNELSKRERQLSEQMAVHRATVDQYHERKRARDQAQRALDQHEQRRQDLQAAAIDVEPLAAELEHALVARAHEEFVRWQKFVSERDVWDGTQEELEAFAQEAKQGYIEARASASNIQGQIIQLGKNKVTAGVCKTCGQTIGDAEAAAQINAEIEAQINQCDVLFAEAQARVNEFKEAVTACDALTLLCNELAARGLTLVEPDPDAPPQVPPALRFVRKVDPAWHRTPLQVKDLETKIKNAVNARLLLEDLQSPMSLKDLGLDDIGDEPTAIDATELTNLRGDIAERKRIIDSTEIEYLAAVKALEREAERIRGLKQRIEEIEQVLPRQSKNNALIKALREARVQISEVLWSRLMAKVSELFSNMRGWPSVVTYSADGFAVDGKLSKPSGSTLDILGVALRITMARMFTSSGLLLLDEPSAGCDVNRTLQLTGTVAASGFEQIIMITHKEVDESSGNLILIG